MKQQKLYRHHSLELQNKIRKNKNKFIHDELRRFNFDKKNQAKFYFYSPTIKGAKNYENKKTKLFRYVADVKLLDLRKIKDRRKLTKTIDDWLIAYRKLISTMLKDHGEKFVKQHYGRKLSKENIYKNDYVFTGLTYWGQSVTDYNRGVILKKEIIKLGYDGVIIQDGRFVEIALVKPAICINCT